MNKIELLAPVGSEKALHYAVMNGADAVYLGGKLYGARSYAENFDKESIIKAIKFCHLYGVKIYVTVNTIIFDNEIEEFINYINFLYHNNVDAVIMQDKGMIKKVRELFPNLEIHASTQLHNHNNEGVKLLRDIGVKRVVFARELSIEEINKIDVNIEKEVFVHGALCVCYSGCCLFSAMKSNRSGNRGQCIASCRLPYSILENKKNLNLNDKYLLSTKELNTINNIDKLIDSNINSLKIEGRMKSPEYVGLITKIYREAIDSYYEGKKYQINEKNLNKMKLLFNRKYTNGYLFHDFGKDLMNIKTPNHQGVTIGKVINFDKSKIEIKLDYPLRQEDSIRFVNSNIGMTINKLYNKKGLLVKSLNKGEVAIVDNKINLKEKSIVNKTIDKELINELARFENRKILINMDAILKKGENIKLTITDIDNNIVTVEKNRCLEAINKPLSKKDVEKQLTKLGNTPFKLDNINVTIDDNVFVNNKDLNEIRRIACYKLKEIRENKKIICKGNPLVIKEKKVEKEKVSLNVLIRNREQLKAALNQNVDNIYITDYSLYKENKAKNIYYVLPRVITNYINYKNENLLIRELGSLNKYKDDNVIASDYTLNISNNESLSFMNNFGVNRICLSVEVDLDNFKENNYNTEVLVYGKAELMISKYCMINMLLNNDNKKCNLCKKNKYELIDDRGFSYPIKTEYCNMVIYDNKNIDLSNEIKKIKRKINNFRINLLDEDYNEALNIIMKFKEMIK
ncbi:MAG: DUF3656 domain-containing protein [bacterium]|nr:DUF3656 domain-containing protein [bacterium]